MSYVLILLSDASKVDMTASHLTNHIFHIWMQLSVIPLDLQKLESFVSQYAQLYNRAYTCGEELTEIFDIINKSINCGTSGIILLKQPVVQKCVNKLKSSKLVIILSLFFSALIIHCRNADDLLFSTFVSVPKMWKVIDIAFMEQFRKYVYTLAF